MDFFNDIEKNLRIFIKNRKKISKKYKSGKLSSWPESEKGGFVLKSDTGIELGGPTTESLSFLLWTEESSRVKDEMITIVGPDISNAKTVILPVARIILVGVKNFNEDNIYDRTKEMNLIRFDLNLEGLMMKSLPDQMKEWSRISKDAIEKKYSLSMFGKALIVKLKEIDYIEKVEVIYVTSTIEDIKELKIYGEQATRYTGALNKMVEEMNFDCSGCEFLDVCGDISSLRNLRTKIIKNSKGKDMTIDLGNKKDE